MGFRGHFLVLFLLVAATNVAANGDGSGCNSTLVFNFETANADISARGFTQMNLTNPRNVYTRNYLEIPAVLSNGETANQWPAGGQCFPGTDPFFNEEVQSVFYGSYTPSVNQSLALYLSNTTVTQTWSTQLLVLSYNSANGTGICSPEKTYGASRNRFGCTAYVSDMCYANSTSMQQSLPTYQFLAGQTYIFVLFSLQPASFFYLKMVSATSMYKADFDNGALPTGWIVTTENTLSNGFPFGSWAVATDASTGINTALKAYPVLTTGSGYLYLDASKSCNSSGSCYRAYDNVTTSAYDLSSVSYAQFSFATSHLNIAGRLTTRSYLPKILASTDGVTWIEIGGLPDSKINNDAGQTYDQDYWNFYRFNIDRFAGNAAVRFRFSYQQQDAANPLYWAIDNVRITSFGQKVLLDQCSDIYGCTTTSCSNDGTIFGCQRSNATATSAIFCNDPLNTHVPSCATQACYPGDTRANSTTGCFIIDQSATKCDDGYSCTTDTCDITKDYKVSDGCVHTAMDNVCTGGVDCDAKVCYGSDRYNTLTSAASYLDSDTGCAYVPIDANCNDNYPCTTDTCGSTGCVFAGDDSYCAERNPYDCVDVACLATSQADNQTTGCSIIALHDEKCEDGYSCTTDTCSSTGCGSSSNDGLCDDEGATECSTNACSGSSFYNTLTDPDNYRDSTTGCTHVPTDSLCDDSYSCTTDTCSTMGCNNAPQDSVCPTDSDHTECSLDYCIGSAKYQSTAGAPDYLNSTSGCTHVPDDSKCQDDFSCTVETCSTTGCNYSVNNATCQGTDTAPCMDPYCVSNPEDPNRATADPETGCYRRTDAANCNDDVRCTADTCTAATYNADATTNGCKNVPMNSACSIYPGAGCSLNTCYGRNDTMYMNGSADQDTGCFFEIKCDDHVACTVDECVTTSTGTDRCLHTVDLALCDDGIDCTYELVCDVNAIGYANESGCIRVPMDEWCSDDDLCTYDYCSPVDGCHHDQLNCDDGLACTVDFCNHGVCHNAENNSLCDDGFACTNDVCNVALGKCQNIENDDYCQSTPTAVCQESLCRPGNSTSGDGCIFYDRNCNDGIACTVDTCDSTNEGECYSTPNDSACDDNKACTVDKCDADLGKCTNIPDSSLCTDDLYCTLDMCDPQTGACLFVGVDCSDDIACTDDSCTEGEDEAVCENVANDAHCNDNIACTIDYCDTDLGRCTNIPSDDYCVDAAADQSRIWTCVPISNAAPAAAISGCQSVERDCDDNIACTIDYADANGDCQHTANNTACMDGSECNNFVCSLDVGCLNFADSSRCNDANKCTTDSCGSDGQCHFDEVVCNDEVACTTDSCDAATGNCVFTPVNATCDDAISCTLDICDAHRGCVNAPYNSLCTAEESICSFGECSLEEGGCLYVQDESICNDRIQCTLDSCDGANGCLFTPQDSLCDDGIPCTRDYCTEDGCVYEAFDQWCDDGISCTTDSCDATYGCIHTPVDTLCTTSNCSVGYCDATLDCQITYDDASCSDGIACTRDFCNVTSGECNNVPEDSACDDNFDCSTETCSTSSSDPTGCVYNTTACNWGKTDELCVSCTSAFVNLVEKRALDGTAASLEIRTRNVSGEMDTKISFLSTNQVIIGGSLEDTAISAADGLVVKDPVRFVPVTADSLGECNEVRRGTVAVKEVASPCPGNHGRTCYQDTLVVCTLGDVYEWKEL